MKKDDYKTEVIFRQFKDDKSIIALFPYEIETYCGLVNSYMHIGQHGAADIDIIHSTKPVNFELSEDAWDLYLELTNDVGYDLIIRKKILYRKFSSKLTEFRNKYNAR